jgi:hypothetical protein
MARKAKKTTQETATVAAQPATTPQAPSQSPKLIVVQPRYGRWYVYFKGVPPKENVGCPCKSPDSAMRYMHLLEKRYGATISMPDYQRLQAEVAKEG